MWLALASLCALDPEHGKRLSSVQWGTGQNDGQPAPPRVSRPSPLLTNFLYFISPNSQHAVITMMALLTL